jgi:hypothetical protein
MVAFISLFLQFLLLFGFFYFLAVFILRLLSNKGSV